MKILKNIVLLLLVTSVYNETLNILSCSPGFIRISIYCVQSDSNTAGFTVFNNPCPSFDASGLCISSTNTNKQTVANGANTTSVLTTNTNTQSSVTTTNTPTSLPLQNTLPTSKVFTPLVVSQPTSPLPTQSTSTTTSTSSSVSTPAANSSESVPPVVISTSASSTTQTATTSSQNNVQSTTTTSTNTQTAPLVVRSGTTETATAQFPPVITTASLNLLPQLSQLLFKGINASATMAGASTTSSSTTTSASTNVQTTNINQVGTANTSSASSQNPTIPLAVTLNQPSVISTSTNNNLNPFLFCSKFNASTLECEQCSKGYRVNPRYNKNDPILVAFCLPLDPQCRTYTNDLSGCASCYQGYDVLNLTCVVSRTTPLVITIVNCQILSTDGTSCIQCYKGYYYDMILKQCQLRNQQCLTYASNASNDCASCYTGYRVVKGDCVIIQGVSPSTTTTTTTVTDFTNSILFGLPSIFYYQGTPLQVTTIPIVLPTIESTDTYCAKFTNGICVQCNSRAYFKGGVCQPVSDQCQTFDQNTGACTSCFKGFDLLLNGSCVKGDNQCMTRNSATGLCSTCYLGYSLMADGACK